MERISLNYSMKNIPITQKKHYINLLIAQTEKCLVNLRWRVYFFKKPGNSSSENNYGFKSENSPPQDIDLMPFEEDLRRMIKTSNLKIKPIKGMTCKIK